MLNPHFDIPFRFSGSLPQATNLCVNGGFEKDTSTWTADTGVMTRVSTQPFFGSWHARFVCASNNAEDMHVDPSTIFCRGGNTYTLSAYVNRRVGNRACYLFVQWYDANINFIRQDGGANPLVTAPNGSYVRLVEGPFVAPPNAARALLLFDFANVAMVPGDEFFVDGVQFEIGKYATPYIDTSGTPTTRVGNVATAVVEQNSFQEIANCVETIIRTPLGFRDDTPDFGFPDLTMLEQPVINKDIVELVQSQEPRSSVLMSENPDMLDVLIDRITVEVS